jgi:hemin uptake protein HemP
MRALLNEIAHMPSTPALSFSHELVSATPIEVPMVSANRPSLMLAVGAITSEALLGKQGMCIIIHDAERYVLRRTRNNKLILTK